jgi:hypothetical protein
MKRSVPIEDKEAAQPRERLADTQVDVALPPHRLYVYGTDPGLDMPDENVALLKGVDAAEKRRDENAEAARDLDQRVLSVRTLEANERSAAKVALAAETLVTREHDGKRVVDRKASFPLLLKVTLPLVVLVLFLAFYRVATVTPLQPNVAVPSASSTALPVSIRETPTSSAIPEPEPVHVAQPVYVQPAQSDSAVATATQRSPAPPATAVKPRLTVSAVPPQPSTSVPSGPATTFLPNGKPIRE